MNVNSATAAPTLSDIYGLAYLEFERSGMLQDRTWLVYEMGDGSTHREDVAEYFTEPADWDPADAAACEQAVGRVLDIGCGPGRHASALLERGHEVVAIDVSADAVAVARRRGIDARLGALPGLPEDLGTFDTFLLLGCNLPLLFDEGHTLTVLAELAALARPGAVLLGTDQVLDVTATARETQTLPLRARVEHSGGVSEWSEWMVGSADFAPDQVADLIRGSAWQVDRIDYLPSPTVLSYLAKLTLIAS